MESRRVAYRSFGIPLGHVRTTTAVIRELDGIRWRLQGTCSGDRSEAWFTDLRTPAARHARRICEDCPVRTRCLAAALLYGEEYGIWGGLDPDERLVLDGRLRGGESLRAVVRSVIARRVVGELDEAV
jgi:WhiB family redox-sensing transcriptional regulator